MRQATKSVGHVPVSDLTGTWNARAALHVLRIRLCTAVGIRAHRGAGDGTDRRGDVVAAPAADLMADHTAEHTAQDRAGDVGRRRSHDLLLLDPATLLGRAHHRTDGD